MDANRMRAIAAVAVVWAVFGGISWSYDFSADMVAKDKGQTMKGKAFVSGDKSRMEMQEGVIITRLDKKVTWMLMAEQKMYVEGQIKPGAVPVERDSTRVEKVLVGKEAVDGKPATKYKMTFSEGRGKTTVYQWFLDGNGFPVKTAALDNSWSYEYKNIKEGTQPASLFEVPAGYKKMDMPAMPDMPM